jgi:hypothetical protein
MSFTTQATSRLRVVPLTPQVKTHLPLNFPDMSESTRNHKRKRSLQNSPVDLTKMKMAMQRVRALKEELAGIEETEGEVEALMTHVNSLEDILRSAKKPVVGL